MLNISFFQQVGSRPSFLNDLYGLVSPIQLETSTTKVFLHDYFVEVSHIERITAHPALQFEWSTDKAYLYLTPTEGLPKLSVLTIWIDEVAYGILVKTSRRIASTFIFDTYGQHYNQVEIAGDMNNWSAQAGKMQWEDGKWHITYELNPGKYAYQFVLDGQWTLDPANPDRKDNNLGGINSVRSVHESTTQSKPRLYTLTHNKKEIKIGIEHEIEGLIVFWNNFQLPPSIITQEKDSVRIQIPKVAKHQQRSYIRVFAYNGRQEANELKILLHHGKVLEQSDDLQRTDKEAYIMYFILVDRFLNSDSSIDAPVLDDRVHEKANFHGGDLAGILQKVKEGYFKQLGVNTLWLSPITQNPLEAFQEWPEPRQFHAAYHGYWPTSHLDIDHRFGTYEVFEELIESLHQEDANIILDFVSNHVHQEHPLYKTRPDWVTPLQLPDGRMNVRLWNDFRFSTWFELFLPTLDYDNPEVVEEMTNIALHWLIEFELDGFRHDATKHIPQHFWRALSLKMKKEALIPQQRTIYQVGESFGSRELIGSYTSSGMLDGQFDFNLYFDTRSVFALPDQSFKLLHQSLMESFTHYGELHMMCNITGNHDLSRFISYAGGSISFEEDTKMAGWTREVGVGDPIGYKRLLSLIAFTMTIPGIPVLYYGDEIGMPGAEDPDNRRPMKFDGLTEYELYTKQVTAQIIQLRKNKLAFTLGEFQLLHLTDTTYAYARSHFDQIAIVAFNKSSESQTLNLELPERFRDVKLKSNFGCKIWRRKEVLKLTLEAESFDILT
ncbi:MAG: alpha-amylase family glycosyl hydrolase [Flammeovirgaceae bacterium]